MQVALIDTPDKQLNTHLNLCPFVENETDNLKLSNLLNITDYVQDSQASELIILHTIELIPASLILDVFTGWVNKVSRNGKIAVIGLDARIICKRFGMYRMQPEEFNILVYGENGQRKCMLSIDRVSKFLQSMSFKIQEKFIKNITYTVTAIKE